jgi:citrate lyase subunit beta / citryl-CoA lyase
MRSLLFVPADSDRKLEKAPACGADILVLDLEDAVATERKIAARDGAANFLKSRPSEGPQIHIRVNGHKSGLLGADLDAVVPARPDAILLPKSTCGGDIALLSAMIAVREAMADLEDGAIRILAIATETPGAIFQMGTYRGSSARLAGLVWSSEDLMAALGAETGRDETGEFTDPFRLARTLCLYAAADAGVTAIDRVFPNFRDGPALKAEALAARRDGFTAKTAIHPDQVAIINEVFTPTVESIDRAKAIVAAFEAAPGAGVVGLDGEMLDLPHFAKAKSILARARLAGS